MHPAKPKTDTHIEVGNVRFVFFATWSIGDSNP